VLLPVVGVYLQVHTAFLARRTRLGFRQFLFYEKDQIKKNKIY
jgi:hypothetical protein